MRTDVVSGSQLLIATIDRIERKLDVVALDVRMIQIEQAEMRGVKKAALYIASVLGAGAGAAAGFIGHRFGAW